MTRPVKGFLTKRGRYFDKKIDAQTCDAIEDFNEGLLEYLDQYFLPPLIRDFIMGHMRYFLTANREIAEPYIKLVTEMPEPEGIIPTDPVNAPGMTDLMVLPESVDDFLEQHPLPEEEYDETTSIDDDFTHAFLDPEGGSDDASTGHEDVRPTGVPGEDAEE